MDSIQAFIILSLLFLNVISTNGQHKFSHGANRKTENSSFDTVHSSLVIDSRQPHLHEKDLPTPQFSWGGLYPRESPSREVKSLDGVWNFRVSPQDDPDKGFNESWFSGPLSATGAVIAMPVPSSYNDVTQDKTLRDHIGWAWYDTSFYVPPRWLSDNLRVMLRLGSVHYNSIIYVNGLPITSHVGGHLPILADVTSVLKQKEKNLLTVAVNNTLTPDTIPQGSIVHHDDIFSYPPGYFEQKYSFDFFNYAGIHRPVFLYTTPTTYIDSITVKTTVTEAQGVLHYSVDYNTPSGPGIDMSLCSLELLDASDRSVANSTEGCVGSITLENPQLWWPYLMNDTAGYLYTLMVRVYPSTGSDSPDVYPLKVGLREVGWSNTSLTINGRMLYIRGCGKHEDSDIRGKGYDAALVVKDFQLLKWLGANAFRTSHYPYAEEIMDRADAEGIMVIDESPAVALDGFGSSLETRHITVMRELVARDTNRASVIMWSVANEPRSNEEAAADYFKAVVTATKAADPTRPVTCVLSQSVLSDLAAESLDVIWVNRYFSWYTDTGHLELIYRQTVSEFSAWHLEYKRPIGISEYGAGTISGLHFDPSFTWSEEYQAQLLLENFRAFDDLRAQGYFIGEMIWNFADFMTAQSYLRVGGNRKGVFTRTRQPKTSAYVLRERYLTLAGNGTAGATCHRPHRTDPARDLSNALTHAYSAQHPPQQ